MKKIKREKNFDKSYLPVVLGIEDVSELIDAMRDAADGKEVIIQTDNYQFQSVEELKDHFGSRTLTKLEIATSFPFEYVKLDTSAVKLYISWGPKATSLFFELDAILSRGQRRPSALHNGWFITGLGTLNFLLGYTANYWFSAAQPTSTLALTLLCLSSAWIFWALYHRAFRMTVIRLQRQNETRPFLERNKDQLLMLMIGTLIGSLATFGGVVLKERFYPSTPVSSPKAP